MSERGTTSGRFRPESAAVRAARQFVHDNLGGVRGEVRDTAVLLVSELATNSVRHAATAFTVSVEVGDPGVRVEVADQDPTVPVPKATTRRDLSGRGLAIVARLAQDWGVEPVDGGKLVWFTLTD